MTGGDTTYPAETVPMESGAASHQPPAGDDAGVPVGDGSPQQQLSQLLAEHEKLRRDYSSLKGSRQKGQNVEDMLQELRDLQEFTDRKMMALVRAYGAGGNGPLAEGLAPASQEAAHPIPGDRFAAEATALLEEVQSAATGDDGSPVLDVLTAPELAEQRKAWNKAVRDNDAVALHKAAQGFHLAARQAERRAARSKEEALRKAAREARQRAYEDANVLDLDSGGSAGGGSQSLGALLKSDVHKMSPSQLQRLMADIEAAQKREGRLGLI
ncbi:MAG: hypothetical protein FJ317_07305 [SAR202 cluster bacterium]|nr:hypothetical protein [SAR202 cluster bacterium]